MTDWLNGWLVAPVEFMRERRDTTLSDFPGLAFTWPGSSSCSVSLVHVRVFILFISLVY